MDCTRSQKRPTASLESSRRNTCACRTSSTLAAIPQNVPRNSDKLRPCIHAINSGRRDNHRIAHCRARTGYKRERCTVHETVIITHPLTTPELQPKREELSGQQEGTNHRGGCTCTGLSPPTPPTIVKPIRIRRHARSSISPSTRNESRRGQHCVARVSVRELMGYDGTIRTGSRRGK